MIYVDYGFPFPKLLPDPHHLSTHITSRTPSKTLKKQKQKSKQDKKNTKKAYKCHGACLVLASYSW